MKDILPKKSSKMRMMKKKKGEWQEVDKVTSDEFGSYFGTKERKDISKKWMKLRLMSLKDIFEMFHANHSLKYQTLH